MQKQSILTLLSSYLSGSENVKKVINSPCLDFSSGKMLSYDGTKVFNSNSRFNRGNRRNSNRGRGNRGGRNQDSGSNQGSKNDQSGKSKKKHSDKVGANLLL